jgi:hypothetical protein
VAGKRNLLSHARPYIGGTKRVSGMRKRNLYLRNLANRDFEESGGLSLVKAIEQLSPRANAKAEAKKANKQASDDLKESSC